MNKPGQYEHSDWDLRYVAGFGISLIVGAVAIFGLVWWIFMWFRTADLARHVDRMPISQPQRIPPEPRLQVSPSEDWSVMLQEEQRSLNSYGWIDRNRGVVQIPIDRAMDLLVQRGLPHRETKEASK